MAGIRIKFTRMITRRAIGAVRQALRRQAAVALIGPRQVGKTTLALAVGQDEDALYLDLEAPEDRAKLTDAASFLRNFEDRLVILDEIHRAPEIFQTLRGLIDQGRRKGRRYGRFLILGSASIDLLRQSGESLAGRIAFVEMGPLDVLEVGADQAARTSLWIRGGFPDAISPARMPRAWRPEKTSSAPTSSGTCRSLGRVCRPRRWDGSGQCSPTATERS